MHVHVLVLAVANTETAIQHTALFFKPLHRLFMLPANRAVLRTDNEIRHEQSASILVIAYIQYTLCVRHGDRATW